MTSVIDLLLLEIVRWGILLAEGLIAKQVYHAIQGKAAFRKWLLQLRLMSAAFPVHTTGLPVSTSQGSAAVTSNRMTTWMMLQGQTPHPPSIMWRRLATAVYIVSVFSTIFLAVSYLLRPIINQWALHLLPLLIPLIIIPVPFLLDFEPSSALLLLVFGLSLGILALVLFGV